MRGLSAVLMMTLAAMSAQALEWSQAWDALTGRAGDRPVESGDGTTSPSSRSMRTEGAAGAERPLGTTGGEGGRKGSEGTVPEGNAAGVRPAFGWNSPPLPNMGDGVFRVTGYGAAPADAASPAQGRLMAVGAAQLDALKKLSELLQGADVSAESETGEFVQVRYEVEQRTQAFLRGVRVVETRYSEDGSAEVDVELVLDGAEYEQDFSSADGYQIRPGKAVTYSAVTTNEYAPAVVEAVPEVEIDARVTTPKVSLPERSGSLDSDPVPADEERPREDDVCHLVETAPDRPAVPPRETKPFPEEVPDTPDEAEGQNGRVEAPVPEVEAPARQVEAEIPAPEPEKESGDNVSRKQDDVSSKQDNVSQRDYVALNRTEQAAPVTEEPLAAPGRESLDNEKMAVLKPDAQVEVDTIVPMVPDELNEPSGNGAYTDLILDARGLGAKPALAPKAYTEKGKQIYPFQGGALERFAPDKDPEVRYARNWDEARRIPGFGDRPLAIKVKGVQGEGKSDLVLSNDAALKMAPLLKSRLMRGEGYVVIVID